MLRTAEAKNVTAGLACGGHPAHKRQSGRHRCGRSGVSLHAGQQAGLHAHHVLAVGGQQYIGSESSIMQRVHDFFAVLINLKQHGILVVRLNLRSLSLCGAGLSHKATNVTGASLACSCNSNELSRRESTVQWTTAAPEAAPRCVMVAYTSPSVVTPRANSSLNQR